ncbi:MAG: ATP-binding protein [Anaerotignum sp.]|nr:ATP-binding protein [Anaerotignum sp.]
MAIKSIDILNVLVFRRQARKNNGDCKIGDIKQGDTISDGFRLEFCDGINVIIGENGVGKTALLKMIYSATQWSIYRTDRGKTKRLQHYFSNSLKNTDALKNARNKHDYSYYRVSDGNHCFEYSFSHEAQILDEKWLGLNIQSVFIPTTEMLSHSEGFLSLNEKFNMPFDGTQIDIIVNALLPEAREIPIAMTGILEKISDAIGGTVIQEKDKFYVVKEDGCMIDFSLEAEGLRKLGLLWKLIRNGLLEEGSVLLWDEPEANLNPELYPLVADILLELQKCGVQIFVATHSYNFAKYLEIRRSQKTQVMFHNLYKGSSKLPETMNEIYPERSEYSEEIYSESAYRMEDIKANHIMIADGKLLDEVYDL